MTDTELQTDTASVFAEPRTVGLLCLPPEIQRAIFAHCRHSWSNLMMVCKAFHELASEFFYKKILLAVEDIPSEWQPRRVTMGLASVLDVLANSPHDHARHVKYLIVEKTQASRNEPHHSRFAQYNGIFINALLKQALPRSTGLEVFRWDIGIKISEQLYKVLHGITTLSSVFIRLPDPFPPRPFHEPVPEPTTTQAIGLPMLSGFQNLQSLDIHDIGRHETVPEIQACIQNLSGVLEYLRLSMSRHTWKKVKAAMGDADDPDTALDETPPADEFVWEYVTALAKILGLEKLDDDLAGEACLKDEAESAAGTTAENSEAVTVANSDANEASGSLEQVGVSSSQLPVETSADGTDYARSRRRLTLHTLGLERIVVNASVLSRGIDLATLQSITLLDIGSQVPVWELFARVNKTQPLALSSIHTNHVSKPFLRFVSQLPKLSHIYLAYSKFAEPRDENEQGGPKCSLRDIRRCILKKHAATLQTISVHGRGDSDWYMDITTLALLAQRCQQLEELAVSMTMEKYSTFLTLLPQFTSLVALHISHLNGGYTAKDSLLGVLGNNPQLVLEYMRVGGLDTGFANVIIRLDARQKMINQMEREAKKNRANGSNESDESGDGDDSSDDDSLGFEYLGPKYIFKAGTIHFAETNARIFSKEIVNASFCW
ncbi:f-box domain-containing protein [Ophiostoma piceae UAMH 11346]|uniref:F-box domain-containing protein n=1 Tax=Ophiostoma piceae (strain UAMH 11346) TaxID=1262450 RepID=S3D8Y9_OPHP1|nr:f-box domain-containing protein [Ophiostoma piceae UAMH 11346]